MQTRREFIKAAGAAAVSLAAPPILDTQVTTGEYDKFGPLLPKRILGKTGQKVTMYCMGGSHIAMPSDEKISQAIIEKGIEVGIRFFDTANTYAGGKSEILYGKYLTPKYRDNIFLYSKTRGRNAEEVRQHLEESFRRMKTDYLDLWIMHMVGKPESVEERVSAGVLEFMLEAKQKGLVRHLGFSGHEHSSGFRLLMNKVAGNDPFDVVQLPVNAVDAAKRDSFTLELVPDLVKREYAVLGMKSLAHGRFFKENKDKFVTDDPVIPDNISLEEALWFNLSQPVTAIVIGTRSPEEVEQNADIVRRFVQLTPEQLQSIVVRVAKFAGTPDLEYYRPLPGTY